MTEDYCCSNFTDHVDLGELEKDANNIWNIVCSETGRYEMYIDCCPWCGKNWTKKQKTKTENSIKNRRKSKRKNIKKITRKFNEKNRTNS